MQIFQISMVYLRYASGLERGSPKCMHNVAQIGKFECSSVVWGKGLDIVIRGILLFCVFFGKKNPGYRG